jgi:hypothetical protein
MAKASQVVSIIASLSEAGKSALSRRYFHQRESPARNAKFTALSIRNLVTAIPEERTAYPIVRFPDRFRRRPNTNEKAINELI